MEKVFTQVKLNRISSYMAPSYNPYDGYETRYIYTMNDADGRTYVWKTTKILSVLKNAIDCVFREDDNSCYEGDVLFITGSIKGEEEYKGQKQTVLTRVEVKQRVEAVPSTEEKIAAQMSSIRPTDKLVRMSYREYKNSYNDCETILNSYDPVYKNISVIIRDYKED